jgi:rhodanese-related sulfurtransferase
MGFLPELALMIGLAFATTGCSVAEIPAAQEEVTPVPEEVEEPAGAVVVEEKSDLCDGEQLAAEAVYELMTDDTIEVTVIDIRRPGEYEEGHVPGALYLGIMQDDFLQRLRELPRDDNYIIICWHGNTSRSVVFNMMREGFSSVCDVAGGYDAWRAAGLPLEEGEA